MFIRVMFSVAFLLLAIAAVLFYLHFGGTGNLLVVRLDSIHGTSFISTAGEVWGILLVILVINLINTLLTSALLKREPVIAVLLPFASLVLDLLILIYIAVILTAN